MKVAVFGLGHVGSVTAACLARAGHRVVGVDACHDAVDAMRTGQATIVEPGLEELIAIGVSEGRLSFTTDAGDAVRQSDVVVICVPTPGVEAGKPDFTCIELVGRQIGASLGGRERPLTVLLRTTVLPGTTEQVLVPALRSGGHAAPLKVAINPEFLRQGSAVHDFAHPPLVLAGCDDLGTASVVRDLYAGIDAPFVETSVRTAELVKYSSIAFHSLKVCFANEMGNLCDALGANGREVMRIFAMDRKINVSDAHLKPGFAFGGTALPKDVRALLWAAKDQDMDLPLLSAIMPSNGRQIQSAVEAVLRTGRRRVAVVGLAFRPNIDELRESPVVALVKALIERGCDVRVFDRSLTEALQSDGLRRELDAELPHLLGALETDVDNLVDHADVLVVGRATQEAALTLGLVGPDCVVVDLTRGAVHDVVVNGGGGPATSPVRVAEWQ
jgi:GDP-mannose 6-dehydrogenase